MNCLICPRKCNIDRSKSKGVCGVSDTITLARASLHFWEEPCISGKNGSGAVFFSGCNLKCVFCQNSVISAECKGKQISSQRLKQIFAELIEHGAHNINLVTPTHYTDVLLPLLDGISVPVVWNSSGYESTETLKKLQGKVDVYLPDMKYADSALAKRYSAAEDYPQTTKAAIEEMIRQVGRPQFDKNGMLIKGVIIRHLILPGQVENTKKVIDFVSSLPKGEVLFSLMSQYTPYRKTGIDQLDRRITKKEYIIARNYMLKRGITHGFVQELSSAKEEYTPEFDFTGI